jgi:hypothetical protein
MANSLHQLFGYVLTRQLRADPGKTAEDPEVIK